MKIQDVPAYRSAFNLSMSIFEMTKNFPAEEFDAVTNPIRRSSRNVCVHLSEAMRRCKYVKYFQTTLVDADSANAQTQTWLAFASSCQYADEALLAPMVERCAAVAKMIQHMMDHPERFR